MFLIENDVDVLHECGFWRVILTVYIKSLKT